MLDGLLLERYLCERISGLVRRVVGPCHEGRGVSFRPAETTGGFATVAPVVLGCAFSSAGLGHSIRTFLLRRLSRCSS